MSHCKLVICLNHPYFFWNAQKKHVDSIKAILEGWEVIHATSTKEVLPHVSTMTWFYGWKFPEEWVSQAKKIKWIHTPAAGKDYIDSPALSKSSIEFTNTLGFHGEFMAQHIMAMLLYFAKGLPLCKKEFWPRDQIAETFIEVVGEKLAIVGCGAIGEKLGPMAKCFGLNPWGYRRNASFLKPPIQAASSLEELLSDSTYVVNLLPNSDETKYFFNKNLFQKFKKGSIFINVGRGSTVNESDLLWALDSGILKGAGLDVLEEEPPQSISKLFDYPHVLISPHSSAFSSYYLDRAFSQYVEKIKERQNNGI